MKLAFVIASLGAGGAERVASLLCNRWAAAGHSVCLITFEAADTWRGFDLGPDIRIVRLDMARASSGLASAIKNNVARVAKLRRSLRAFAPDVTISFLTETNVLALLAGIGAPWATVVSERIHAPSHPVGAIWSVMRRYTYRLADAVVVQTNAMANWVKHQFGIAAEVIPNPVDVDAFGARREGTDRPSRPLLVAVGRLEHQKGFDLLIRAFAGAAREIKAWDLDIYGEGTQRESLQQLIRSSGMSDRIKLRGVVTDIGAVYARAAAIVHPARYEGYPNVVAEALAAGKPIIATDCPGGTSELLGAGKYGVLVRNDDSEALRHALVETLSSDAKLAAVGLAARSADTLHSPAAVSDRWLSLFGRVLTQRRRGA